MGMRQLTDSDIDFFANVMPEWCGKTAEEGRKNAEEWKRMRRETEEERDRRIQKEADELLAKVMIAEAAKEIEG